MSVIIGYVPTPEGQAALQYAVKECLLRECDLVVVQSSRRSDATDDFAEDLEAARSDLAGAGLSVDTRTGTEGNEPAEDLIEAAEGGAADLIIIGLRRRTPIGKLILGSNAQRILLDAPCPVIAVKAEA
ncbi:MAG: universal stress protein [Dermatophilaceae bacterium]|nr:universal stress protein [Intrasporangiaceae bacterium]